MAKKSKAPFDYSTASRWAGRDVDRWQRRNWRFEEEQDLWELMEPRVSKSGGAEDMLSAEDMPSAKPGVEVVVFETPRILVDKVSRVTGRAKKRIEYKGRHPDKHEVHQIIENLCRWIDREWSQRWSMGLHASLQYEVGSYAAGRGWLISRVGLNPEEGDRLPVIRTLHDAANVYPYEVGGRIVRVTEQYKASVSDLLDDPAMVTGENWLSTVEDDGGQLTVSSIYVETREKKTGKPSYWHCIIGEPKVGEGGFLKEPVEIGYMPWVITLVQGAPYRGTPWDEGGGFGEWMGTSILTALRKNFRTLNKLGTMLFTVLANSANPAKTIYTDDEAATAEQLKEGFKAGDTLVLRQGDKMEIHRIGPQPGDFQMAYQMMKDIQHQGSVPPALFGDTGGITSGAQAAIVKNIALDYFFPLFEAMKLHESLVLRKALEIIAKFWPEQMEVFVPAGADRPAQVAVLDPRDIEEEGAEGIRIEFEDVTPEEFAQTAMTWAMLVRERLASMRRARGQDGLKFDDPDLEDQEVLADLVKTDEQVVKFLVPWALAMTGQKMAANLYGSLHEGELRALAEAALRNSNVGQPPQGGGVPGQVPGVPPVPQAQGQVPPGQVPFENTPMLPGQVASPQAQTGFTPGSLTPDAVAQMMAMLQPYLQSGGVGGGGIPPAGGEVPFIPGPMIPGV